MVDLNDVQVFAEVVEAGSFARAARRLGKPANSVSRRIQELEAALGVQLMRRSTRKLVLTDAGQRLYAQSATRLAEVARSVRELVEDQQLPSGSIRVAAQADFFDAFQMDWVAEFLAAHPRVQLEFLLDDHHVDLLENGVDLALRAGNSLDPHLVAKLVGQSRNVLVASPAYLSRRGTPDSVAELAEHDHITFTGNPRRIAWELESPEGYGEIRVTGRFRANTVSSLVEATCSGLGIALLPVFFARRAIQSGRLVRILPDHGSRPVRVHFVHHAGPRRPKAAAAFQAFASAKLLAHHILERPGAA
jgi:LysR family transcriptional regulator AphB